MDEQQIFWRPNLTSSCHFSLKDLEAPCGVARFPAKGSKSPGPPIIQIAGWISGFLLEAADVSSGHLLREDGQGNGSPVLGAPEEVARFENRDGEMARLGKLGVVVVI